MRFDFHSAIGFLLGFFIFPDLLLGILTENIYELVRINLALSLAIIFGVIFGRAKEIRKWQKNNNSKEWSH